MEIYRPCPTERKNVKIFHPYSFIPRVKKKKGNSKPLEQRSVCPSKAAFGLRVVPHVSRGSANVNAKRKRICVASPVGVDYLFILVSPILFGLFIFKRWIGIAENTFGLRLLLVVILYI